MTNYVSLQDRAYGFLKQKIENGDFVPDVFYSEAKVAAEIGMSRTPMKDALTRLSQEKYIDIIPSKGFCLHVMSDADIQDTYQARTAIEGFCAVHLRSMRTTPEGRKCIFVLKQCIDGMKFAVENGEDVRVFFEQDLRFHEALISFPGNEELLKLFNTYVQWLSDIAIESLKQPGRPEQAIVEHQTIFDLINSDSDTAVQGLYSAVMYHMEMPRNIVLELLEKKKN